MWQWLGNNRQVVDPEEKTIEIAYNQVIFLYLDFNETRQVDIKKNDKTLLVFIFHKMKFISFIYIYMVIQPSFTIKKLFLFLIYFIFL